MMDIRASKKSHPDHYLSACSKAICTVPSPRADPPSRPTHRVGPKPPALPTPRSPARWALTR